MDKNNGQFFECLNMAQLWKLPIIFVVENNKWAIGMPYDRATSNLKSGEKLLLLGCTERKLMAWMY